MIDSPGKVSFVIVREDVRVFVSCDGTAYIEDGCEDWMEFGGDLSVVTSAAGLDSSYNPSNSDLPVRQVFSLIQRYCLPQSHWHISGSTRALPSANASLYALHWPQNALKGRFLLL